MSSTCSLNEIKCQEYDSDNNILHYKINDEPVTIETDTLIRINKFIGPLDVVYFSDHPIQHDKNASVAELEYTCLGFARYSFGKEDFYFCLSGLKDVFHCVPGRIYFTKKGK